MCNTYFYWKFADCYHCERLASKYANCATITLQKIPEQFNKGKKDEDLEADFESVEKVAKYLQRIQNHHQILRFLYPYSNELEKEM